MVKDKKMNLVFVSCDQYPGGDAASNRHMAYAKGLVELKNKITFILLSPQNNPNQGFLVDGINFISASTYNKDKKFSPIIKLISTFKSITFGKREILSLHLKNKFDAVVLLDTSIWMIYPFLRLCKKNNIVVLHERTEYPFIVDRKGIFGKVHNKIYLSFILPEFDGIYVISQALKRYFENITKNKVPVSVVNMVVDPSRFKNKKITNSGEVKYLVYCGTMNFEKDGVDMLIRSFGKALETPWKNEDIKLMLIGDNSNVHIQDELSHVIRESRCSDKVIFTGQISRQRIPDLLMNAYALALARPDNKQAEGGFPTKLGEYLATGKPVIVTNVGEIGLFLKDGENSFIAEAGSVNSFSQKIRQVFEDYPKALQIGLKGKELINNEFNYLTQAKKIVDLIEFATRSKDYGK
jgi:glycosyltransferase involved in cell wall biosynthesis